MMEDQHQTEQEPQAQPALAGPYRWSHNSTPKLDAALATAQGEIRAAAESAWNAHLKNRYADLAAVVQAIRGALSAAGIARYQTPWTREDGQTVLTTRLACEGQWVEGDFVCLFEQQKGIRPIQSMGSTLTYVKRYALAAMVGVPTGDDDDGEASGGDSHGERSDDASRWRQAVQAFGALGVEPATILRILGKTAPDKVTAQDHEFLGGIYRGLRNGAPEAKAQVEAARQGNDDG